MEWDKDAREKLKKAPFFIRKLAKAKVERAARAQGMERIPGVYGNHKTQGNGRLT